jgi:hypothetical protein
MAGMRIPCLLAIVAALIAAPVVAEAQEPPLEEIVVSGEFPGPGLWKITRADAPDGHALWIVADPPPLPKRMQWKSREVEARMLASQEILLDSTVAVVPDEKIGVFKGLTLLPSAMKARKNPDGAKLKDLVPPDLYARWLVEKKKYLGGDSGVEKFRPIFAAQKLGNEAFKELDLRGGGVVWAAMEKLATQRKIKTTRPHLRFTFKADEIRSKIKDFQKESLADLECFAISISLVEALGRRDVETARAKAWATADLASLAVLPPLPNPNLPCAMAVLGSQVAKEIIPADIRDQVTAAWMDAAVKSLGENSSTFAIVPLDKLTRPGGYLDGLRAKGYVVEAPQ